MHVVLVLFRRFDVFAVILMFLVWFCLVKLLCYGDLHCHTLCLFVLRLFGVVLYLFSFWVLVI